MRPLKAILPILALFAIAMEAPEAKRAPKRVRNAVPADCKVMADSLQKLYEAGDPSYLTWDISPKCDSSQLYTAYYYQGLGFYLLSAWKESLYFLTLAKEIGGPKDEEILYHLWNVNKKLDRYQEMERATLELHRRYPNSFFLMEILDEWRTVKHPSQAWTFGYSSKVGLASNSYLDKVYTNRLRAGTGQKHGNHRFHETGSFTVKAKLDDRALQGFQGDLGGEYEYQGFTAELDYGAGYESRNASDPLVLVHNGIESRLVDSNWNWLQGRAAVGYSYTTKGGWNLGWNVNALQLSKDWRVVGFSHTQSFLFPSWILLGYVDYQIHSLHLLLAPGDTSVFKDVALDGMQTFMANLTPYFSWDRHSLGVGPTYYASRSHYGGASGLFNETEWDHSITATASYGFEMRNWIKFNLSASYGWEFDQAKHYAHIQVYGVDGGFALSF